MLEENPNTNERQTMSRKETAKYLGVCVGTLRTLDIPCAKVWQRLIYFRDSVNKWLYSQEEERKGKKRRQKPKPDEDAESNAENPKLEADAEKAKQTESKNRNAGNELFEGGAENAKSKC